MAATLGIRVAEERSEDRHGEEEESRTGRRLGVLALLLAAIFAVFVLTDEEPYEVTAEFANASQLVAGNEVVVGGTSVGTVESVELGPEGQALVTFTVEEDYAPLRRGTTATIRSPSLSQIAGRQVQLTLPPSSSAGEEIESGEHLTQAETVSAWVRRSPDSISSPALELGGRVSWTWRPAIWESEGERIVAVVPR